MVDRRMARDQEMMRGVNMALALSWYHIVIIYMIEKRALVRIKPIVNPLAYSPFHLHYPKINEPSYIE